MDIIAETFYRTQSFLRHLGAEEEEGAGQELVFLKARERVQEWWMLQVMSSGQLSISQQLFKFILNLGADGEIPKLAHNNSSSVSSNLEH